MPPEFHSSTPRLACWRAALELAHPVKRGCHTAAGADNERGIILLLRQQVNPLGNLQRGHQLFCEEGITPLTYECGITALGGG